MTHPAPDPDPTQFLRRLADLSPHAPHRFELSPDDSARAALAAELDLLGLRKLRFAGTLQAQGKRDWRLTAQLGATVIQPCVVTLEPVTTRIEAQVDRLYTAEFDAPSEDEVEMPEDDSREPLPEMVDLFAVMAEALALNLPLYPRKSDADLGEAVFTEPGKQAMRDEDARPFAGLAALRDQLKDDT